MVDWSLARQLARLAANAGSTPPPLPDTDFAELVAESERQLTAYTRLAPEGGIPAPERVDRATWAEVNVDSLGRLLGPVTDRLGSRFEGAGPFAGPLRTAAGGTVAAECGLVLGYMSQRVLGQYELSLLEPERPPRLLFVGPNLSRAVRHPAIDADSFLRWIVLHEATHVLKSSGVPRLRHHTGLLVPESSSTF